MTTPSIDIALLRTAADAIYRIKISGKLAELKLHLASKRREHQATALGRTNGDFLELCDFGLDVQQVLVVDRNLANDLARSTLAPRLCESLSRDVLEFADGLDRMAADYAAEAVE